MSFKDFTNDIENNLQLHRESERISSIKSGFPPKAIDLTNDSSEVTVSDKGIKDGDQLIIEFVYTGGIKRPFSESPGAPEVRKKPTPSEEIPAVYIPELDKYIILRNIPDDNSCLFNSMSSAISGFDSYKTVSPPEDLRNIVVQYIEKDPELYSELILGKPREEYCEWIRKKDSWGGAIELAILADWFNIRVVCIDIESGNFIRFENEKTPPNSFIILIYSGIHYDLLSLNDELSQNERDKKNDISKWPIEESKQEELILAASQELCKLLQENDYATNTTTFRVRCLDCYQILVGEMGASKHAEETGHVNFGEVKKKKPKI
ncbi:Ubiquitin thioesterase OTU1 [Spathaspora sp. JA1]|nr:Ubiquitin thioesterase OTU1 [Spathaspora sp. JA1]